MTIVLADILVQAHVTGGRSLVPTQGGHAVKGGKADLHRLQSQKGGVWNLNCMAQTEGLAPHRRNQTAQHLQEYGKTPSDPMDKDWWS